MEVREGTFVDLLPDVQALATRLWTPGSWAHAGQLAWSSAFTDPDSAVAVWRDGGQDVAAWTTPYPGPQRVYQGIGFRPGARTLTFVRNLQEDL